MEQMSVSGATSSRFGMSDLVLRYATCVASFPSGQVTFFFSFLALRNIRVWIWSVTEAETKNGRVKKSATTGAKHYSPFKMRQTPEENHRHSSL